LSLAGFCSSNGARSRFIDATAGAAVVWAAARCIFELTLRAVQPGSSIMPGKVNAMPRALLMPCGQLLGYDAAIAAAGQPFQPKNAARQNPSTQPPAAVTVLTQSP
jgi:hypothetical protein